MSVYDDIGLDGLTHIFKESTKRQMAIAFASEMMRHITVIKGYAEITKIELAKETQANLNNSLSEYMNKVIEAAKDLEMLGEALVNAQKDE
jgi:hypothetical protein